MEKEINSIYSKPLRIFTWNIHGSYLYYLSKGGYEIYVPYNTKRSDRYIGRGNTYPYGDNVKEIPANEVKNITFDLILYQADENYFIDQHDLFSEEQLSLPKIYLEHDPPWGHPTDTVHPITEKEITLIHVTHFNKLMWNSSLPDVKVIEHGVDLPETKFKGIIKKGLVVINNLPTRGRMLEYDIFKEVAKKIPLDLIGMGNEEYGIGEIKHPDLPEFMAQYSFFFHPIRYTSLGLSLCEAMMIGMPIVALSTTETPSVIKNGFNGFAHNDIDYLIDKMKILMNIESVRWSISDRVRETAKELFDINRFVQQWETVFESKVNQFKAQIV